ncbi:methyltransferase domain-containing protein [Nonomuraea sp. LPB2021202275-12-8]|uniref:methyltransferase domain-containing protein n=1 Tax=Nonomuraea sp. LPB2021202275-12-8 TaxID=3120159 RepID=UPI00300CCD2C
MSAAGPVGPRDAMEFINEQDEATLRRFVDRLEARGADPVFTGYREEYFDRAALTSARTVLEVGCGTGLIARALAGRKGFGGRVTAVDQSPVLVDAARRLSAAEGVDGRIDFLVGDAHALDLPGGTFDAVIAHTLISHVGDPLTVLREAARVVRPGGTVTVFDGDYASLSFGGADAALGQAMEQALLAVIVSKPRVMRDLPRVLVAAGLRTTFVRAHVHAEVGTGAFFPGMLDAFAPLISRAGLLPAERVDGWLAEQRRAMADGTFFAACNYYTYIAERRS